MEHNWKKATLKPAVVARNSDATILTHHLKRGVTFFGRRYDTFKQFVWYKQLPELTINNSSEII